MESESARKVIGHVHVCYVCWPCICVINPCVRCSERPCICVLGVKPMCAMICVR